MRRRSLLVLSSLALALALGAPAVLSQTPTRPVVGVPSGPPPTSLQIQDLRRGQGAVVRAGQSVSVHYVGVAWSSRRTFDASWDRGEPFRFTVGARQVIRGWDQGLLGMRVGGRRRLVIPPELGYGARGAGGVIGPNETLVFVIDLLSAE